MVKIIASLADLPEPGEVGGSCGGDLTLESDSSPELNKYCGPVDSVKHRVGAQQRDGHSRRYYVQREREREREETGLNSCSGLVTFEILK